MLTPDQKEQLARLYISAAIFVTSLAGILAVWRFDGC